MRYVFGFAHAALCTWMVSLAIQVIQQGHAGNAAFPIAMALVMANISAHYFTHGFAK